MLRLLRAMALPWHDQDDGQTMAEYTVVLGVITIAIMVTLATLSDAVNSNLRRVIGFL